MPFTVGKKIAMSQVWDEQGNVVPVTLVKAGPLTITQIKTAEKDGYSAVQVGFEASVKNITKPLQGHLKATEGFRHLYEFDVLPGDKELAVGDVIDISVFKAGDKVKVSGTSKGKGFQGVVKRHGFAGGPKTHGDKDQQRMPGSIGSTGPQRVIKGQKMAGRMGGERVTVKNIKIIDVDAEHGILTLKGALPGNKKNAVIIKTMGS